ncbi:MAG: hypothetical protein AAF392_00585 [Bacteroidota bacterium]
MKRTAIMQIICTSLALAIATNLWAAPTPDRQWYRMCTPHFDILFPADFSREAKRVANTLEHLYEPVAQSLCVQPRKISVILRTHKAEANGFVTLAPRRVELFTFPTQDYNFLHTNDWLSLLAIHELRHVAQYEQSTQCFNKILYRLGGESLLAMGCFFENIPLWCAEGDAVGIETALTKGGRGRIPRFGLLYKANLLERGSFSYQKQIFGSYKHLVPDHYKVGYYVTTHLRRKYGADVLAKILRQTTRPMLFPLAVKKVTGRSLRKVYQDTNQELWDHWHGQLKDLKATPVQRLNARSDSAVYTDYSYPQVCEEGIIALKSGIATPAQFILLDTQQKERSIFTPGNIDQEVGFSVAQGKLVWVERIPDLRWEDRSYSVIQLYDNKTKQLKTLTPKGRYGAASLSPDATKIVALASDECYNHQLVMLDAKQGKILRCFPNPDNHYYLTPRWSADGQHIVAVKHANQQATITLINASTGNSQDILPYLAENIGCPVMAGQYIFYNSAYNGIDNIYAIDLQTKKRYQVTSRRYGAYNPTMATDGHWLILNDFTKDGMDVVKMPFDPQQWIPLEEVKDRAIRYYEPLVAQEDNCDLLKHMPNRTYPIESYQPWRHLMNIHSWGLDFSSNEKELMSSQSHVMLAIASQDLLSTASLKAGYAHDFTGKAGKFLTKFTYKGWYPIIDIEGSFTKNYDHHYIRNKEALNLEASLPLTWMHGQYTHKLSLGCLANIISLNQRVRLNQQVRSNAYIQIYGTNLSRTSKKSLRDIHSPWAQMLKLRYGHIPYKAARQFWAAKVRLCFPSLLQHHSLQVSMGYQYSKLFPYHSSDISPRGYQYKDAEDLYTTSLDYIFPIWYPDWSKGLLLYIKRLKAHAFYDMAYEQPYLHSESNKFFYSLGLALSLDMHFLSWPIPLEIGISYMYLPGSRNYSFTPVLRYS